MTFEDILKQELFEETKKPKGKGILFLDIDDTLLTAKGIHIHRTSKHPDGEAKFTPAQYAKLHITAEDKAKGYYDYREFRDGKIVKKSIEDGDEILSNIKLAKAYKKRGWEMGILTARGMESVIIDSVSKFLNKRGIKVDKGFIHAINTSGDKYPGKTDYEKKLNVLKKYKEQGYDLAFLDDDPKNIKIVRDAGLKIRVIKAHTK